MCIIIIEGLHFDRKVKKGTKFAFNLTSRADEGSESNSSETPIDIGQSHGGMGLAVREA
jgi:hypothetical protein